MASKQDRTFARTAMDIERKYNFDKSFSEAMNLAEQAKRQADEAYSVATNIKGIFFFIRYSAYSDGTNMTEEPQADTVYMGTCSTNVDEAPTDNAAYTWTKILGNDGAKGEDGETGVGVSEMKAQFYLSTSKTTQTGGSWVDSMPTWSNGKYLWIRHVVTYTDGNTAYTSPQCDSSWEAVTELDSKLNHEEIFNRLSQGNQGVYRDSTTGNYYINASYIKSGEFLADLIKAGVIKSKDGKSIVIDLDDGTATLTGSLTTARQASGGDEYYSGVSPLGLLASKIFSDGLVNLASLSDSMLRITSRYSSKALVMEITSGGVNRITGLSDPTGDDHAVNKAYADKFYDSRSARSANTVLAAPNGSSGTASFRKLVAGDIPGDCIVAQGTFNGWSYRKWSNGEAECWMWSPEVSTSFSSTWGNWYVHDYLFPSQPYPFDFTGAPNVYATPRGNYSGKTNGDFFLYTGQIGTAKASPSFSAARPTKPSAAVTIGVCVYVKGRWK